MPDFPKEFDHTKVDPKWYAFWEEIGAFRADPDLSSEPFSMVIPPPNVTGSLHIGHALNQTLPDIVARWQRMRGRNVLWLPGTDHAGIATQNVVEKQLSSEGKSRHDLGREKFESRVLEWVKTSHGVITGQMRKLGSSVDWSRERFTLDETLSRAVRRVFVSLYHEGLIYRDKYIVNWCPRCRTALSDLEVDHQETQGSLYHIVYPCVNGDQGVTVATTRPETMFGDTGVAVNPNDSRYQPLVGEHVRLPIVGRELPIVADDFVDPAFGTGAVKVTPAHDLNDFQLGLRHNLPQVMVIDEDGRMTSEAGPYAGKDRFEVRTELVTKLESDGLLVKTEDHSHAIGRCQRCSNVVEPLVSTQWFVKVKPLADAAITAVKDGRIRFVPENWEKTYFEWMENIHDWCISRQLWWGHRIPAWYCDECSATIVAEKTPEACVCGGALRQDKDVLDTWFSSGLWPFSTMGWPEKSSDFARFYPTDLMITAFDIIFFWVARMIMFGLKFTGDVPFRDVYITSIVRDAHGQKMSKSRGNVVNPLDVMDEIGADAFRFTLAALASPGMDISLSQGRLTGYRQFVNKIWNASRFVLMNLGEIQKRPTIPNWSALGLVDRWILHRVNQLSVELDESLGSYRFDVAADRLYHFFWHEYADWYLEFVKQNLEQDEPGRDSTLAVLIEVHDRLLRMLHPFMPFITEEVWQKIPRRSEDERTITLAKFPTLHDDWHDEKAVSEVAILQEVIATIRTARAERGVPPSERLKVIIEGANVEHRTLLSDQIKHVRRLARLEVLEFSENVPHGPDTVRRVVRDFQVHMPLVGIVNRQEEKARVLKELERIEKQKSNVDKRLANPKFLERADPKVVAETRVQSQNLSLEQERYERIFQEMGP